MNTALGHVLCLYIYVYTKCIYVQTKCIYTLSLYVDTLSLHTYIYIPCKPKGGSTNIGGPWSFSGKI
jgi:hypothetical protein